MLFFSTNVFAKEKISNYSSAWKVGNPYNTPVSDQSVIRKHGLATTVLIAREIYENGARFCPTRIKGSNTDYMLDGNIVLLSYQDNPSFTCYTICKSGYHGSNCDETGVSGICGNTNYESVLEGKLKIDTKSDVSLSSYSISAFHAGSETSGYGLSQVEAYQSTTLGIIGYVPHGVIVAPIKILATAGVTSSISVNTNGRTTTLCASGYTLNNEKCEKTNCSNPDLKLKKPGKQLDDNGKKFCDNYENYDATKHDLVEESSCYSYVCKEGGFDTKYNHKDCIEDCGKTKQSGVLDTGYCKVCNDNQMFNGTECASYTELSMLQLKKGFQEIFDCWQEFGGNNYKTCVLCKSPKSYNKTTKICN